MAHRNPHYSSIAKAYERAVELTKSTGLNCIVVYEYFPLGKVCSVPAGTTAFRRDATPGVLIGVVWKENSEKNAEVARNCAHELAQIVTGAQPGLTDVQSQGYSNYGVYHTGQLRRSSHRLTPFYSEFQMPRLLQAKRNRFQIKPSWCSQRTIRSSRKSRSSTILTVSLISGSP